MQQQSKVQEVKKEYSTPKLSTHGDVATLTQNFQWPIGPGSNIVVR